MWFLMCLTGVKPSFCPGVQVVDDDDYVGTDLSLFPKALLHHNGSGSFSRTAHRFMPAEAGGFPSSPGPDSQHTHGALLRAKAALC